MSTLTVKHLAGRMQPLTCASHIQIRIKAESLWVKSMGENTTLLKHYLKLQYVCVLKRLHAIFGGKHRALKDFKFNMYVHLRVYE